MICTSVYDLTNSWPEAERSVTESTFMAAAKAPELLPSTTCEDDIRF